MKRSEDYKSKLFIKFCDADALDEDHQKHLQAEATAIRRVGFVFLAYNVEYW